MTQITSDSENEIQLPITGKRIKSANFYRDANGYDLVALVFDDNSRLLVREQGQAGYVSVEVRN